jgi:large subunit ribosomal protein L25
VESGIEKESGIKIMSEKVVVKAEKRENSGKGFARRLRMEGKIPVTVYGGGGEAVSVSAKLSDLAAILRSDTGHNTVFSLDIAGFGINDVIFQDRQIDPLKGRLIHADLRRLAKGEKIEVTVPVHLIGEPVGVKIGGGLLEQQMREIRVLCESSSIPESIDVDVTNLELNHSLHISDIKFGTGVEVHEDAEAVIASVVLVKAETETVEEAAEPEVIGMDKEE